MINQASLRRYAVSHHAVLTFIDLLIAAAQQKVPGKAGFEAVLSLEVLLLSSFLCRLTAFLSRSYIHQKWSRLFLRSSTESLRKTVK
jgi:hypothetical protein